MQKQGTVLQRKESAGPAELPLASAPSSELQIYPWRLVELGTNHVQPQPKIQPTTRCTGLKLHLGGAWQRALFLCLSGNDVRSETR